MGVRLELVQGEEPTRRQGPQTARPARVRIVDAALDCIAGQGLAGTTLDDVARRAGCSRATVYRSFPGGRDAVLGAVVETEVSRFFSALAVGMGAADDLEDVLVAGMHQAALEVTGHEALQRLLLHEPEVVLAQLAFARMDEALAVTCAFTAPFLGRWLDPAESRRVAEWAARLVVSYLSCPAEGVDLTDGTEVRRLVRAFVLPGIRALAERPPGAQRARPPRSTFAKPATESTKGAVS